MRKFIFEKEANAVQDFSFAMTAYFPCDIDILISASVFERFSETLSLPKYIVCDGDKWYGATG